MEVRMQSGTFCIGIKGYATVENEVGLYRRPLIIRVISKLGDDLVGCDLGHKRVSQLKTYILHCVSFLDESIHLILLSQSRRAFGFKRMILPGIKLGDLMYMLPYHICPRDCLV